MSRHTGAVGSLELLAGRARAGDRRAAAQLRRRMTPQVRELARALSADPRTVPVVVRSALNDALADDGRPYTWALVAAVQRHSTATRSGARRSARSPEKRLLAAVGVLCDMQGHTHSSAAALLDEPVSRVAALHAQGRSDLGVDGARTHCRGWHLVSRLDELTVPEQEAGRRHLAACRSCEEALAARAAARLRLKAALPVGGTVLGGGVAAVLAAVGGGSATAGAAAVGAAAVLGTAGTMAVTTPPAAPPPPVAPAQVPPEQVAPEPDPVDDQDGQVVPAPVVVDPAPAAPAPAPAAPAAPARPLPQSTAPAATPAPATEEDDEDDTVVPDTVLPELPLPLPTEPPPPTVAPSPSPSSVPLPLPSVDLRPPLSLDPAATPDEGCEPTAGEVEEEPVENAGPRCDEEGEVAAEDSPLPEVRPALRLERLRDLREPRVPAPVSGAARPSPRPER